MLRYVTLFAILTCAAWCSAQQFPRIQAARPGTKPKIDGVVSADEWKDATKVTGFTDPVTNRLAADQTDAWIGFDDEAIYVAFYAHDPNPAGLVGREIKPGADFDGEDTVTFRINPFGTRGWDGRSRFTVNVLNTQSESIAGGRAAKREWRGEWTSAVMRQPDGYSVEMRIPWKVLNYPSGKSLSMDINFERFQARTLVGSEWANTTTAGRAELTGQWLTVAPPAASNRKRLQFLAYGAPEYDDGTLDSRSGLDARYAITPLVTGLLSINPDFRNIEQQVEDVGFTRTERFLGEARPFFNEGSGFFNIGGWPHGYGSMFYSRRIETFDYGSKVFGQVTPTLGVGALATVDAYNQTSMVARANKTFGPKASANVYATGVETPKGRHRAYGGGWFVQRGSFNFSGDLAVEHGQIGQEGGNSSSAAGFDSAGEIGFAYDVPHWFSVLQYEWIKPNFDPPLAFVPWRNRKGFDNYSEYWTEYRTGPLRSFNANLYTTNFYQYDGAEMQKGTDGYLGFTTRNDVRVGLGFTHTRFFEELDRLQSLELRFNSSNRFKRYGVYHERGTRGGRQSRYTDFGGSYRLLKRLDLSVSTSVSSVEGERTERLLVGTVGYELSPTRSISGRFVGRNGKSNAYMAYRNSGASGTELFVILGDPNADSFRSRLSVKLVWAF